MSGTFINSGAAQIYMQIDGAADKPALLLSNSLAADLRMWDGEIARLTRTHRVIRYDTRGHGRSSTPPGAWSFDDLVGDMVAVLDAAGAARADVIGLSLGGMTALGLGLAHPERVMRLVVCAARADNPPAFLTGWDQRIAAVRTGGMAAIVQGTLERWFTPAAPQTARDLAQAMILGTDPEGYILAAEVLKTLNYLPHLGGMVPPVFYLSGECDMAAPPAVMAEMARATRQGGAAQMSGVAHLLNLENSDGFLTLLAPWLAGAEA